MSYRIPPLIWWRGGRWVTLCDSASKNRYQFLSATFSSIHWGDLVWRICIISLRRIALLHFRKLFASLLLPRGRSASLRWREMTSFCRGTEIVTQCIISGHIWTLARHLRWTVALLSGRRAPELVLRVLFVVFVLIGISSFCVSLSRLVFGLSAAQRVW